MNRKRLALPLLLAFLATGCGKAPSDQPVFQPVSSEPAAETEAAPQQETATSPESPTEEEYVVVHDPSGVVYLERPSLLGDHYAAQTVQLGGGVSYQTPEPGLNNVYVGGFYYTPQVENLLVMNSFAMRESYYDEFFQLYETNRYGLCANYVTVDSMMHTYHLYFAYLLKKIEKEHLCGEMLDVSRQMLETAQGQYEMLRGTEWEEAARLEVSYFAVGTALLDPSMDPSAVSPEAAEEYAMIMQAGGIHDSVLFPETMEDYSQYKPRGYYDSSEELSRYFRAMMWYGRMGFRQDVDLLNRASVLVTLGLEQGALESWARVYDVTSFFAGASDDFGYYEEKPVIEAIYGSNPSVDALVGHEDLWAQYTDLCKKLPAPQINSVPSMASDSDEEHDAAQKGFRFMGQRFSIDEASFIQLVYRQVQESADGQKRLLPDALDFPAALGSDTALSILKSEGLTDYPNYDSQMSKVRETVRNAPQDSWTANLYSAWIYTLTPLLETKDDAYPPFMRTEAWRRKSLVTFEGSYTELKHDTILYSKQVMGEMGGGELPEYDDRGYVEAEPVVFSRLTALVNATVDGLSGYGLLDGADRENLNILAELSGRLGTIAEKELSGELPTDEEFDLIRSIGGQLEHFWQAVMDGEYPDEEYHVVQEHPAAIVADIATDPNGTCLEVGTGRVLEMLVIVEVDGQLKIASGPVYSFYEFEQPLSNRLTDVEWRKKLGISVNEDFSSERDPNITYPSWYNDLLYVYSYN